jgi:hypothetical protein
MPSDTAHVVADVRQLRELRWRQRVECRLYRVSRIVPSLGRYGVASLVPGGQIKSLGVGQHPRPARRSGLSRRGTRN